MCTVLLPPGVNPIAVKYIYIIYIYIDIKMGFKKWNGGVDWMGLAQIETSGGRL
jgi:hypothetical protein